MATAPTTFTDIINEGSTALYTTTLKDELGVAIPLANIDTLTLTLCTVEDGTIINTRDDQDVLNTNNVTVHATSGLLTYALQALDNVINNILLSTEVHRATFKMVYNGGVNNANWDVDFSIRNLRKVV